VCITLFGGGRAIAERVQKLLDQAIRNVNASLKGHGFSRAAGTPEEVAALAAEGMHIAENKLPKCLNPDTHRVPKQVLRQGRASIP
jgi:hypothetical protein